MIVNSGANVNTSLAFAAMVILAVVSVVSSTRSPSSSASSSPGRATAARTTRSASSTRDRARLYGAQSSRGPRYGASRMRDEGTNAVNGRKLELTLVDDGGDPDDGGRRGASDLIGKVQGDHRHRVVRGRVALRLRRSPTRTRCCTSPDRPRPTWSPGSTSTRSAAGRQSYQDVLAASSYLAAAAARTSRSSHRTRRSASANFLAVQQVMGNLGGQKVNRILVPLSAQDFTPFAQQIKQQRTDLLFIAWAGPRRPRCGARSTSRASFAASTRSSPVSTSGRRTRRSGRSRAKISFLSHYVSNAPRNGVNDWLVTSMRKRGQVPDLFTPDGFVAGQMIVRPSRRALRPTSRG